MSTEHKSTPVGEPASPMLVMMESSYVPLSVVNPLAPSGEMTYVWLSPSYESGPKVSKRVSGLSAQAVAKTMTASSPSADSNPVTMPSADT